MRLDEDHDRDYDRARNKTCLAGSGNHSGSV